MPAISDELMAYPTEDDGLTRYYGEHVTTYSFASGDTITLCGLCLTRSGVNVPKPGEPQASPIVCDWCHRNENNMRTVP